VAFPFGAAGWAFVGLGDTAYAYKQPPIQRDSMKITRRSCIPKYRKKISPVLEKRRITLLVFWKGA